MVDSSTQAGSEGEGEGGTRFHIAFNYAKSIV